MNRHDRRQLVIRRDGKVFKAPVPAEWFAWTNDQQNIYCIGIKTGLGRRRAIALANDLADLGPAPSDPMR